MNLDIRTILAATDFSTPALAAVRRAALLARAHDARLELVHVLPAAPGWGAWQQLWTELRLIRDDIHGAAREDLEALAAEIQAAHGVRTHAIVAEGKPFAEIAARGETVGADLIVVGAHGENILTPLVGTTAHRVLSVARAPVLLVKQMPSVDTDDARYRHVLAATDFSADAMEAATSARRLCPQSSMTLFHAYQAPFETKLSGRIDESALESYRRGTREGAQRRLQAFASATNLGETEQVLRHGPPGIRVREYAAAVFADLIAIGSEELPRLQSALLGSVSLDVVMHAHSDVLLARAGAS